MGFWSNPFNIVPGISRDDTATILVYSELRRVVYINIIYSCSCISDTLALSLITDKLIPGVISTTNCNNRQAGSPFQKWRKLNKNRQTSCKIRPTVRS